MSKHLAICSGPQGEKIPVICDNETEARALEAEFEARNASWKPKRSAEAHAADRRAVENLLAQEVRSDDIQDSAEEACPTCGRPLIDDDADEV